MRVQVLSKYLSTQIDAFQEPQAMVSGTVILVAFCCWSCRTLLILRVYTLERISRVNFLLSTTDSLLGLEKTYFPYLKLSSLIELRLIE